MTEAKTKNSKKTDPLFDGHPEIDITKLAPNEKLLYLSRQIQLRKFIKENVKKVILKS